MADELPSAHEAMFAAGYIYGLGTREGMSEFDAVMCKRAHNVLLAYARGELIKVERNEPD